jgi:SAM-dependent methyltransferase
MNDIDFEAAVAWYDLRAKSYAAASNRCDPSLERAQFLEGLATGARILDAGCGAGRDLAAFRAAGHVVTGLDPSAGMRRICRDRLGKDIPLRAERLQDVADPPGSWDGIWAMASLLHVPSAAHAAVIGRLHAALAPGGRLYVCLKTQETGAPADVIDAEGRPMARMSMETAERIADCISPGAWRIWATVAGASSGRETLWTNILMCRA